MLIRRCRHAFGNGVASGDGAVCIGTSATMASGGSSEEQRREVAKVSQALFGVDFTSEQVIGETLERATPEIDTADPAVRDAIRAAIVSDEEPPSDYESFRARPLASWIESTFGVREEADTGKLLRQTPRRLGGDVEAVGSDHGEPGGARQPSAALELAALVGTASQRLVSESGAGAPSSLTDAGPADAGPQRCAQVLRRWLLKGSGLYRNESSRFSLFAFRLHQFLTRGDTVWASLEPEAHCHLEIAKKAAKPGEPDKPLFPLVFCRHCGTAYYRVRVAAPAGDAHGRATLLPREDRRQDDDDGSHDAYLHLSEQAPWPRAAGPALLARLPDALKETTAQGMERIRPNARKDVPEPVFVDPAGRIVPEGEGVPAALIHGNFLFCLEPSCGVTYTRSQRSERFKLATLGVDNRSTATTILAVRSLIELQHDRSLAPEARKLLSFTDNRQDASLQAGHFNDFVQVALLRSALYRACEAAGKAGLRHGDLSRHVFDAMNPRFEDYAADPEVRGPARQSTRDAMRRVLEYFLYRDLERGWRVTAPNLEDCALLRFEYEGLDGEDGLLGETELWESGFYVQEGRGSRRFVEAPAALRLAPADTRKEIIRTLLDELRRALAVKVDVLDPQKQHDPRRTDQTPSPGRHGLVSRRRAGADGLRDRLAPPSNERRTGRLLRLLLRLLRTVCKAHPRSASGAGAIPRACGNRRAHPVPVSCAEALRHRRAGAHRARRRRPWLSTQRRRPALAAGRRREPPARSHAPARRRRAPRGSEPLLRRVLPPIRGPEGCSRSARAHRPGDAEDRLEREERFREGDLPLLFCSPTMELGVDIAQLNLVNLRNVPPTPANYAQRSGRAGRGGQPALVFTYCAGRSPHDQYFYREPARMVAGTVAPPRIDLRNRDLVRSHVHAIWMEGARPDLGRTLTTVLDLESGNGRRPLPVKGALGDELRNPVHRGTARARADAVIAEIRPGARGDGLVPRSMGGRGARPDRAQL